MLFTFGGEIVSLNAQCNFPDIITTGFAGKLLFQLVLQS